jgi:FKBP-type peptidyl-prolyl cis-trans isomerase (trigger factor)
MTEEKVKWEYNFLREVFKFEYKVQIEGFRKGNVGFSLIVGWIGPFLCLCGE